MEILLSVFLLAAVGAPAQNAGQAALKVPLEEMTWERLPDLGFPRAGHALLYLDGELTVLGGHTTGFIPTPTAEYYREGVWTTIPTIYTHDGGFCLPLKNGSVLLGGGLVEPFGVGQSYSVERYRRETHSFEPLPILSLKRAVSNAAELEDGTILVSGNWYADDALEVSRNDEPFVQVKETAENRSCPWILPTAPDNALVFSGLDSRGFPGRGWVDRLQGEPFQESLLQQVQPITSDCDIQQRPCEIGNPAQGDYDYLLLASIDSLSAMGILRIHGEEFSLLPLETEIPLTGLDGSIRYWQHLLKHGEYVWALGTESSGRAYLLQIGYKPALMGGKATVKLYYTEPLQNLPRYGACTMLPDGRIALAGGIDRSNYTPFGSVYIFDPRPAAAESSHIRAYGVITGILTALALVGLGWWMVRRRKKTHPESLADTQEEFKSQRDKKLFKQVSALMDDGLFKQKGLTIADLATSLGTNTKYISSCINAQAGCSFLDYVNGYRIRFAQQKMREDPPLRLSDIADAAGFTSESAFYRNFKAFTGQTPAEWMARK